MNKLHHRQSVLSHLNGLKIITKKDRIYKNFSGTLYQLILEFINKIEILEYRTESERDADYGKLQNSLKGVM